MSDRTLVTLLSTAAERWPHHEAVKSPEGALDYQTLYRRAAELASMLVQELGVAREARVGILTERSPDQVVAFFGVALSGAACVLLSPGLKAEQLAHIIADCTIELLITTSSLAEHLPAAYTGDLLLLDSPEVAAEAFPAGAARHSHAALAAHHGSTQLGPLRPVLGADLANIIYTSGSTGRPKGVVLTHRNLVEGAAIVSEYLGISHADRLLASLPFHFDYGLNQLTSAVHCGATVVLHDYLLPKDLLRVLEQEAISGFAGLRPLWLHLFRSRFALKERPELPALRYLTNTGGALPRSLVEQICAFFPGAQLFLMYGLTEAFRSTFLPPQELRQRPGSIGKALPGVEILLVDEGGNELCGPNQSGELVHRGALVSQGYWNNPAETARVFRPNPRHRARPHLGERVVFSGDLVRRDEEGFLYFVGRKDELIKIAGHRLSPQEVEEGVLALCEATQALAFATTDDEGDQLWIVLEQSAPVDPRALARRCRQTLASHMVPSRFLAMEHFPRTPSSKVDRVAVRKWALAQISAKGSRGRS